MRVEERLFLDAEYFRQLRAAEDELIDEYLYEGLSAGERERFKDTFLTTPERRESLRVARALREYISRNPPPDPAKNHPLGFLFGRAPLLQLSLAALALLIVGGLAWLAFRRAGPPGPSPAPSVARQG
ncbi:MAG TPA: hypothetical protein VG148_02620, partial [Pyrinomonadaceae bacterium]|nr:hypothetical protein [Pyrinomonadaceae bacterium]